jgi:hypothetical protein
MREIKFNDPGQMAQQPAFAAKRLKFEKGDKALLRVLGNPYVVRSHFVEETGRGHGCSMDFDKEADGYVGACPLCEAGNQATEKFAAKAVEIQRGKEKVGEYRLWTMGLRCYQELSDVFEKAGDRPDIVAVCLDAKYQRLQLVPVKERRACEPDPASDFDMEVVGAPPSDAALAARCGLGTPSLDATAGC